MLTRLSSKQEGLDRQDGSCVGKALIEGAQGGALFSGDRQMQGVACSQAKVMMIGETGRSAEMRS